MQKYCTDDDILEFLLFFFLSVLTSALTAASVPQPPFSQHYLAVKSALQNEWKNRVMPCAVRAEISLIFEKKCQAGGFVKRKGGQDQNFHELQLFSMLTGRLWLFSGSFLVPTYCFFYSSVFVIQLPLLSSTHSSLSQHISLDKLMFNRPEEDWFACVPKERDCEGGGGGCNWKGKGWK